MAYKISIWIVLFLLFFNGGAVMLEQSGTFDYLGVQGSPGDTQELQDAEDRAQDYETNNGAGGTLFGLYNSVSTVFETVFNAVMPGAAMLKRAGGPGWFVNFLFTGLAIVPGIDIAKFLRSG